MQIGPKSLARALEVKQRCDAITATMQKQDDVADVDLDNRPGEVVLSLDAMRSKGLDGIRIPVDRMYKDEVQAARLSWDPKSGAVQNATVQCSQYYDSSYGRSGEDILHYGVERKNEKGRDVLVYTQQRDESYSINNSREIVKVDAGSGDILSYSAKEYAETFPHALENVFTSVPGLFLVGTAGLLCGAPGTLGGVLFGPVAGVVAAGATAVGLAYYKTRPWNPHLPRHNE